VSVFFGMSGPQWKVNGRQHITAPANPLRLEQGTAGAAAVDSFDSASSPEGRRLRGAALVFGAARGFSR
jgi:hypothetical protein